MKLLPALQPGGRRDAGRRRGARDYAIVGVSQLAFKERDRMAQLRDPPGSGETTRLRGSEEAHVEINGGALVCAAGADEDDRSKRVVEHCGDELALDMPAGVAERFSAFERDRDGTAFLIGFDQLPAEGHGARRLGDRSKTLMRLVLRDRAGPLQNKTMAVTRRSDSELIGDASGNFACPCFGPPAFRQRSRHTRKL